ncbi:T9SS type A sorting domain-containing protein [Ilyomonas limi]|uniref:T9SS type A sorting domain-containing protein n=1 Tax=Ilyomonas limi TaxID=2575867 RepID=A0A4U3LA75_9BACT|nr:T9SS type A sorting domain-containing protein [Ilyomonas limi]TKK71539.1 T9SS type A sorting domain-containing protein [Ilyomonas limi]
MYRTAVKIFCLSCVTFVLAATVNKAIAQTPSIKWQMALGGSGDDVLTDMQVTYDKGFIVAGYSKSDVSASKSSASYNNTYDFWIVKLDSNGNKQWDRTYGGTDVDEAAAVIQTRDLGFLIGGSTISPASGNKTDSIHNQSYDYWVIKLDKNGNLKWQKTVGANYTDKLSCLGETSTRYLAGGISYSDKDGDKRSPNYGSENSPDFWVAQINKMNSRVTNSQAYGSTNDEFMTCMHVSASDRRTYAGYSYSPIKGFKTSFQRGVCDYWVSRTDALGKQIWEKSYGGYTGDYLTCIAPGLSDSGYLFGGYSTSPASFEKSQSSFGFSDYWIVRTDSMGNKKWDKTIGGDLGDYMQSVAATTDGGFLLGGYSNSNVGFTKSEASVGGYDYWIVKVDKLGNVQWNKTYGGTGNDKLTAVKQIGANEYILGGTSNSPVSGDKTLDTFGGNDIWLLRLSASSANRTGSKSTQLTSTNRAAAPHTTAITSLSMNVAPNPVQSNMTVSYSSPANAKLLLKVLSEDGKVVLATNIAATEKGSYTTNVAKLPAGIYYITLQSGTSTVTKRIVKE